MQSLMVLAKLLGQLDLPWWKRRWQVTSPDQFEHNRSEVLKWEKNTIYTPVYSFFGRAGYLPEFLSERYMNQKQIRAFLDIFHNRIIDLWIKANEYNFPDIKKRSCTLGGLVKMIQGWYKKKYSKHLRVRISQFQPERYRVTASVIGKYKIGTGLGSYCNMLNGIHILVSDRSVVHKVQEMAQEYCREYGRVRVKSESSPRLGEMVLGRAC